MVLALSVQSCSAFVLFPAGFRLASQPWVVILMLKGAVLATLPWSTVKNRAAN